MLGSLGEDAFSDRIKQSLNQYNVNSSHLQVIDNASTGVACIWIEDGDNRIVLNPGANNHHHMKDIESVLKTQSQSGDVLLMQMEIPIDIIEKSIELASSLSLKIVLNLAPHKPLSNRALKMVDLLIVNQLEGQALLGEPIEKDIKKSLKHLLSLGPKRLILTLGSRGSVYHDHTTHIHLASYDVDVIDTTGAGDAFIGCFIANQVMDISLEQSLKRASACAAMTIQKVGVHPAIPTEQMIDSFLEKRHK